MYLLSALTGFSFFLVFYVDLTFKEHNDLLIPPETPHWLPSDPNPRVEYLRAPPRSRSKSLVERVVESIVPAEELVHRSLDVFLEEEDETLAPTQEFNEGEASAAAVHQESPEVIVTEKTNDQPQTATEEKKEKHPNNNNNNLQWTRKSYHHLLQLLQRNDDPRTTTTTATILCLWSWATPAPEPNGSRRSSTSIPPPAPRATTIRWGR